MIERAQLLTLADRIEAATADQQRELLLAAFEAVHGKSSSALQYDSGALGQNTSDPIYRYCVNFSGLMDAGAFLDAAMMLMPEGAWWSVMRVPCAEGYEAEVANDDNRRATTPAFALTAAALRALANQDDAE